MLSINSNKKCIEIYYFVFLNNNIGCIEIYVFVFFKPQRKACKKGELNAPLLILSIQF